MDDVGKMALGAGLSIAGGFIAQLYSEYLKVRAADHDVLLTIHEDLQKLYALATGNVRGTGSSIDLSNVAGDTINQLHLLTMRLRTRGNRRLAILLMHLCNHPFLIAEDTLATALNVTQNRLNRKFKAAYERDKLTKMVEKMHDQPDARHK